MQTLSEQQYDSNEKASQRLGFQSINWITRQTALGNLAVAATRLAMAR